MRKLNENHKTENAKIKLEKNRTKLLLLIALFWLIVLLSLSFVILIVARKSNISLTRFFTVMFGLPIFTTVVEAFILWTTDSFKKEKFITLITLAFKINFQGINSLSDKNEDNIGK